MSVPLLMIAADFPRKGSPGCDTFALARCVGRGCPVMVRNSQEKSQHFENIQRGVKAKVYPLPCRPPNFQACSAHFGT